MRQSIIPLPSDFPSLWKTPENQAMKPVFEPEPTPEEREALEVALARLLAPPLGPRSAWWQRGLEEALEEQEEGYSESS
jgi:hypothetical protein